MTDHPRKNKKKRISAWVLILIGMALAMVIWLVIVPAMEQRKVFAESYAVSAEHMQALSTAIAEYETANGERPMKLSELVDAGLLRARGLVDERRSKEDRITVPGPDYEEMKAKEFVENPDVLYFPALRASDPADNVLLCTLLLRSRNDKYRVIYNDGRLAELEAMELVIALNNTYEYIGSQLSKTATTNSTN